VLDTVPVRVFWKDRESRYLGCNLPFARDAGLDSPDGLLGKNDFDITWREQAELYRADDRKVMETGLSKIGYEEPQTTPKGDRIWLRTSKIPLKDAGGKVIGVLGTYEDITERKRVEESLRRSETLLSKSQAIAHIGSWELDLAANRLTWSDEVFRMFGLRPNEFAATYGAFLDIVHPDDRAAVDAAYSGSLREGRDTYEIEHRIIRHDAGEVRVVHEKCEHVKDHLGRIVRSVGMVQDITERKRTEQELREREHHLSESQRIAHIGSWSADLTGQAKWTDETYRIYGVSPKTFTPTVESLINLLHPEDRPASRRTGSGLAARFR
jgi:PAS domain S-box-containing protein